MSTNTQEQGKALTLQGVCMSIQGKSLFHNFSAHIEQGEILTLMGPSGSGKSSLLAFICGCLPSDFAVSGECQLNGQNILQIPPEKRKIGILFQDSLLFPHMNVGENLIFGIPSLPKRERAEKLRKALESIELEGYERKDPTTLSGGQKSRVALMRTLLSQPNAILLDEPFSKLDADLRSRVRHFTFKHLQKHRLPTLMVTHDPEDAPPGGTILKLD